MGQAGVCGAYRWSHAEAYSCCSQVQNTVQMASPAHSLLQEGLYLNSRAVTTSPSAVVKPRTQGKNSRSSEAQNKINEPSPRQDTYACTHSPSHTHIHTLKHAGTHAGTHAHRDQELSGCAGHGASNSQTCSIAGPDRGPGTAAFLLEGCFRILTFIALAFCVCDFFSFPDKTLKRNKLTFFFKFSFSKVHTYKGIRRKNGYWFVLLSQMTYFPEITMCFRSQT